MIRVAIFASGRGSNADNILNYFRSKDGIHFVCVVTNRKEAGVIEVARKHNLAYTVVNNADIADGQVLVDLCNKEKIDWIVLAGFLRRIPVDLIDHLSGKILNIHPALLPKYGGKGMYGHHVHRAVKNNNETETGITIHLVNAVYDDGAILFQAKCEVSESDDVDQIAQKVHSLEYQHFPRIIEEVLIGSDGG